MELHKKNTVKRKTDAHNLTERKTLMNVNDTITVQCVHLHHISSHSTTYT